jgi:hypothetical protein
MYSVKAIILFIENVRLHYKFIWSTCMEECIPLICSSLLQYGDDALEWFLFGAVGSDMKRSVQNSD